MHDHRADFKYALWVNHVKNPRFKQIEVPELGITAELPKSLAVASIAVRLTVRRCSFKPDQRRVESAWCCLLKL